MATDARLQERFLYHSFPRRGRNSDRELSRGLQILTSMCTRGLLLTPEVIRWSYPHARGSLPRILPILQRRVCFTELSPRELSAHAEDFGHFALEFTSDTLRALGGMPVSYIPMWDDQSVGLDALGHTLVCQLIDAKILTERVAKAASVKDMLAPSEITLSFGFTESQDVKTFTLSSAHLRSFLEAFTHVLTPPELMTNGVNALLSFFYPADDVRHNKPLHYYRQHEWRITGDVNLKGSPITRELTHEEINSLCESEPTFYDAHLPHPFGHLHFAKQIQAHSGINGRSIIASASRVIVPDDTVDDAQGVLRGIADAPPVIAISELG